MNSPGYRNPEVRPLLITIFALTEFAMNTYLRAEIDGNAQNCAHLINQLLNIHEDLLIDQHGFLLVPANRWDELNQTAAKYGCALVPAKRSREAA
jgi:hypothetical protein